VIILRVNSTEMDSQGYPNKYPAAMEVVYKDGKVIPKLPKTDKDLPKKDTVRWRNVLYDFTQASTIHGLNHITEDTPFRVRR
jgi:hypothetical protein